MEQKIDSKLDLSTENSLVVLAYAVLVIGILSAIIYLGACDELLHGIVVAVGIALGSFVAFYVMKILREISISLKKLNDKD